MTFPFSEAAERNKAPILEALRTRLPERGRLLEVASGTGQHCEYFASLLPDLHFVPSDIGQEGRHQIDARLKASGLQNVSPSIPLNVLGPAPQETFDAVYCANMIHIAPSACSAGLFRVASSVLKPGSPLITYGPYKLEGRHTSESNQEFERWLLSKDPDFGVRDLGWLEQLASEEQISLVERLTMPANNFLLVWRLDG